MSDAAHEIGKLLAERGLTLDQMQDALIETMALYIVSFTEEHDRHRVPEVVRNFATALEAKVNALMDAGKHA